MNEKPDGFYLAEKDFYKELRIRGYNYKDAFKTVVKARSDGLHGKIGWKSNWATFIDGMLQILVLEKDSRDLMLPVGVRRIVIDPKMHESLLEICGSDQELDVVRCMDSQKIQCGGVEMQGFRATSVNRRKPAADPVLECYKFVPHFPTPSLSQLDVAKFCVQLALENLPMRNVMTVEIDAHDGREPLTEFLCKALEDLPLIKSEAFYLTPLKLPLSYAKPMDEDLSAFTNVNLIVNSNCLENSEFLDAASIALAAKGFIIARESLDFDGCQLPLNFKVVAMVEAMEELIVMVQVSPEKYKVPTQALRVFSDRFDWIEDLKELIKAGPVVAYSERDELSGILGLINCIRLEPGCENVTCVFINDFNANKFDLADQFYQKQLKLGLAVNVLQDGEWGTYRHLSIENFIEKKPTARHSYVSCLTSGDLSSLTWIDAPIGDLSKENVIRIQYAALNFRDAMLASGKLVLDFDRFEKQQMLGFEYSGVMKNGRRVMGMAKSGALATHVEGKQGFIWDVPGGWSLEQAATVPIVYSTVYLAFFIKANVKKGKSILIHAGTGGVGLAAIRVAFAYGLEVFTTCSNQEKKMFLLEEFPQLKESNIGNSRNISFEDMVMHNTKGKGVDYVLNSLSEDKLQASIRCLAKRGTFLEIGRFDMMQDSKIGMSHFLKQINFQNVPLDEILDDVEDDLKVCIDNQKRFYHESFFLRNSIR